jgi:hypothetical protein
MPDTKRFSSTFRWGIPSYTSNEYAFEHLKAATIFLTPIFAIDTGEALCALLKPYGWPTRQLCETNSGLHPVRMLLLRNGRVVWRADVLPEWVKRLSESLPKIELA